MLLVPLMEPSETSWDLYYDMKKKTFRGVEVNELPRFKPAGPCNDRFISGYSEGLSTFQGI
jgi:hypothetical protein